MGYAALVGDVSAEKTMLSEDEYALLKHVLELRRSDDKEAQAITCAIDVCCTEKISKFKGARFPTFLYFFMGEIGANCDEVKAMLARCGEEPIFMREDEGSEEYACLKAFLRILQKDDWFRDFFFQYRLERYAEKTPTPLELMQEMMETAGNFEADVNDAKKMLHDWPGLIPPVTPIRPPDAGMAPE